SFGRPLRNVAFANDQRRSILPFEFVTLALWFALAPELPMVKTGAANQQPLWAAIKFHHEGGCGVAAVADHSTPPIISYREVFLSHRIVGRNTRLDDHGNASGVDDNFAFAHTDQHVARVPRGARVGFVNGWQVPREFLFIGFLRD